MPITCFCFTLITGTVIFCEYNYVNIFITSYVLMGERFF